MAHSASVFMGRKLFKWDSVQLILMFGFNYQNSEIFTTVSKTQPSENIPFIISVSIFLMK